MPRPGSGTHGQATQHAPFWPVRFVIGFVVIYAALHALYFVVPDRILREAVHYHAILAPGARLQGALKTV